MQKVFRLLVLAFILGLFPSAGGANPTTPKKELLYDDTVVPAAPLVFASQGYQRLVIQFDEPGGGKSYDYSLTTRICVTSASCSEWANVAIASGTVSGTNDLEIVVTVPRDQYQLTISNLSSAPSIQIWVLRN